MMLRDVAALLRKSTVWSAENTLRKFSPDSEELSKAEAYRLYGRCNVDRWVSENLIKISNKKFNRQNLEAIAASSNRSTYLPVAERR